MLSPKNYARAIKLLSNLRGEHCYFNIDDIFSMIENNPQISDQVLAKVININSGSVSDGSLVPSNDIKLYEKISKQFPQEFSSIIRDGMHLILHHMKLKQTENEQSSFLGRLRKIF